MPKSKTEKLATVAFLVNIRHFRPRAELVGPVSVLSDWVGYHVYLWHGTFPYAGRLKSDLSLFHLQQI